MLTAQMWLGHADAKKTLAIYSHLSDGKEMQNAEKLDEIFSKVAGMTVFQKAKAPNVPNLGRLGTSLLEAPPGIEPGVKVLQTSALPLGYGAVVLERETRFELATPALARQCSTAELFPQKRPHLLYDKRRLWCLRVDLNHRHRDFQSLALPTELPRRIWRPGGGSNP